MAKNELIKVTFDDETGRYSVSLGQGSSVPETAFAITVVIKCLKRDGYIKNAKELLNLVKKYLTDPQYEEVQDEETNVDGQKD